MKLYNTLTRRTEPVVVDDPSRVTFYTCGPTVYDDAHIGNFRSFLAADLLRRWLESPLCELTDAAGAVHTGPRSVVHVMNITDVGHMTDDDCADGGGEDKMAAAARRLLEAKKSGALPAGVDIDPNDQHAIARFYTERFLEDGRKLGLKVAAEAESDPSLMPRATDNVDGMIAMIARLIERGHAYTCGDPGAQTVYFDVESYKPYGELSGNSLENMCAGAGGRVSDADTAQKKNPADFLLWKSDPTHAMRWESPWGEGYPGWHIECSVMSLGRLVEGGMERALATGASIDLHSGGEDNIFPHHECERAQSCCATGADRFARHWFHPRFLLYDGEKMSKSKGTFFTARDLFARGVEPAALRLELIKTHYRANANFTEQGLKDSQRMIDRWRRFVERGEASAGSGSKNEDVTSAFADAMHSDLNIAGALGTINAWIGDTTPTRADAALLGEIDAVLGVLELERAEEAETSIGIFIGVEPNDEVVTLLKQRRDARAAKDFDAADAIRDRLASMGYAIKDAPGGCVEVTRA